MIKIVWDFVKFDGPLHREIHNQAFAKWLRATFPGVTKWVNRNRRAQ